MLTSSLDIVHKDKFFMHGLTLTNMKFVVILNGLMLFVVVACLCQDSIENEIFFHLNGRDSS